MQKYIHKFMAIALKVRKAGETILFTREAVIRCEKVILGIMNLVRFLVSFDVRNTDFVYYKQTEDVIIQKGRFF